MIKIRVFGQQPQFLPGRSFPAAVLLLTIYRFQYTSTPTTTTTTTPTTTTPTTADATLSHLLP